MAEFSIQLKSGVDKQALALVVGYGKTFTGGRFTYSTGIKVSRKAFIAAKPGMQLKEILKKVEAAYQSILDDGSPLNSLTLKVRTDLYRHGLLWVADDLHVFDSKRKTTEVFTPPSAVDRNALDQEIRHELIKPHPQIKRVIQKVVSAGESELFGFWQTIIDGKTKPRNGKALRSSTKGIKRRALQLVKEYSPTASFDNMDMLFYDGLVNWLSHDYVIKKKNSEKTGLDSNTIGKVIKELKSVLHLARARKLFVSDMFTYWPVTREKNEVVTLSKDELLKINGLELSGTLDDVRDIFVLAAFLGPRISDFKSFESESLTTRAGITFFEYVQEKTGKRVEIPVHPTALQILKKRQGEFPKMISEQNFRAHLKTICGKAELNDRVIVKIRDGKPQYKKKADAISPHSARRTFASNLFYGWFSKPIPASLCMRYTGHKSEKSFMLYIGATDEQLNTMALSYFDFQPAMKVS